ncbi:hypothetical protein AVJ23_15890 [Pseudoponticoccus marisrubri]|uniref:N-acetylmuramoyl-L-alanine amidase n=1 Tax=Pseudoponticoccus marisrubri TaxID=1685382 RepID=A0A0W7WGD9_9RHOB|nr:hypothetical protein AVJ23_15890 [Pseudoponticoccus marisrubri]
MHDRGPLIYLVHDNEQSAFDTALYSVRRYGGSLVAVESGEKRSHAGQDPNRNFAINASDAATCRDMVTKPAPEFTEIMRALNPDRQSFFLTLHNNDDGYSGGGGLGTINVERPSSIMQGMPAPQSASDTDDALLIAGIEPFGANKHARAVTDHMHEAGYHVIYELVKSSNNDCSFSNFVVLNNLGDYYNIETQHGHTAQQKQILDHLMAYLRFRPQNQEVK